MLGDGGRGHVERDSLCQGDKRLRRSKHTYTQVGLFDYRRVV